MSLNPPRLTTNYRLYVIACLTSKGVLECLVRLFIVSVASLEEAWNLVIFREGSLALILLARCTRPGTDYPP
jgi:hypothetical protein